ncbi:MAG: DUF2336 domain-containing protein [Rickettsiales bacterium]|nr:DUF2336 domain-containing protein [Rickettsiales bacterium]
MSPPLHSKKQDEAQGLVLSPDDVKRLLSDTSSDTRVDMTHKIGKSYNGTVLNDKESLVAEQIFRLLLRDTELKVRVSLAEHVKDSENIPRDIVMSLAKDVAEVSLPVLQYSQVLTDEDLVGLIESTQEISRYIAISNRPKVSAVVSETLISTGSDKVAETLIKNQGAEISEKAITTLITNHQGNVQLMNTLSNRPSLPLTAVDKLVSIVSSTLSETLKQKYKVPSAHIEQEVEKTREKETLGLVRMAATEQDVDKLINQLYAFGRLTPSIILNALCQGNFTFFETALAKLSNIPVSNARTLIADRGELGFRAIYNKTGLPDTMFPAVKLLLRIVREVDKEGERPGTSHYANRVVEQILQYSEEEPVENLSYIIALVRKMAQ